MREAVCEDDKEQHREERGDVGRGHVVSALAGQSAACISF